jgi:GT2 family glycosyltransferase
MRKTHQKTMPKASNLARSRSPAPTEVLTPSNDDRCLPEPAPCLGYVDSFGYSSAAGGWLFNGWVPRPPELDQLEPVEFMAQYERSQCRGRALLAYYQRNDLDQKLIGVIAFMPSSSRVVGGLQHIAFTLDGLKYQAQTGHFTTRLLDQEIVDRVRLNLANEAFAHRNRERLLAITARAGFTGHDTLSALSETVLLEIDEAIICPPGGVLIKGWCLSAPGVLRTLRVRSGPLAGELALSDAIRIDRPDVIAAVGPRYGFSEPRCGFVAYVPSVVSSGDVAYLEVELANGEVGFKGFKLSQRTGLDAIQRILEVVDIRSGEIDAAFDRTLGPAVASLNQARLQHPVEVAELQFGVTPLNPRCSVIVPLYRRIDFVEYQMALFSRSWDPAQFEILYVLDDPPKRRELEILARSTYERFKIPFRVLLLAANVGFAAANNLGLRAARGHFVGFVNSDIFPITDRWIERLVEGLEQNPDIGIIGARLLFEDGSVQHEGCYYRPLSEFGNWTFIEHLHKGLRPDHSQAILRRDAITGACMVMTRALAVEVGGFDEAFITGDFEDSDLCLKAKARGLSCAVDMAVHLYHLEGKSKFWPNDSGRMNLTLYNAWVHQRRWFKAPPLTVAAPGSL